MSRFARGNTLVWDAIGFCVLAFAFSSCTRDKESENVTPEVATEAVVTLGSPY